MASNPTRPAYTPNLKKYRSAVSVEMLDQAMKVVLDASTGVFGSIVAGIKVTLFLAYIYCRHKIVDSEMAIEKQQYELGTYPGDHDSVNQ